MALSHSRRDSGMNYWPGFVDALSTLILSVIFLLTVFMVAQFFLSQEVSGKNTALARLTGQISRLSELLSLEKTGKANLEEQVAQLRASLSAADGERELLRGAIEAAQNDQAGKADAGKLSSQLDLEKEATARAVAQIEILNTQISALRRQIGALEEALGASEKKEKESQLRIADLGQRLNVALAQRVQELSRYRSDFFGKLREILAIVRISAWSVIVLCSSPRSFSTAAPPWCAAKVALNSTSSRPLCSTSIRRFPGAQLGAARRWPYRHTADCRLAVQIELGAVRRACDFGRAISGQQRCLAEAAGGGRLWRVPADRSRQHRGSLQPQSPNRAEIDGTVKRAPAPLRHRGVY